MKIEALKKTANAEEAKGRWYYALNLLSFRNTPYCHPKHATVAPNSPRPIPSIPRALLKKFNTAYLLGLRISGAGPFYFGLSYDIISNSMYRNAKWAKVCCRSWWLQPLNEKKCLAEEMHFTCWCRVTRRLPRKEVSNISKNIGCGICEGKPAVLSKSMGLETNVLWPGRKFFEIIYVQLRSPQNMYHPWWL
jgi:hypothetical protein